MANSKYKIDLTDQITITDESGKTRVLHRVVALIDIVDRNDKIIAKKGDKGGYVESASNLSSMGSCWIADNAMVYDKAFVFDEAQICDFAEISGKSKVYGKTKVSITQKFTAAH